MSKQLSFTDLEQSAKKKQTRRDKRLVSDAGVKNALLTMLQGEKVLCSDLS